MKVEIGNVVNTFGIKGELKVIPQTFDERRFSRLDTVYLERGARSVEKTVRSVRYAKGLVYLSLEGIDNPEDAALFKGWNVVIDREDVLPVPEGTYYVFDLIGCECFDVDGRPLGRLTDVLETGSADVYEITSDDGSQILVPAVREFVKSVDTVEKRIVIDPPVVE